MGFVFLGVLLRFSFLLLICLVVVLRLEDLVLEQFGCFPVVGILIKLLSVIQSLLVIKFGFHFIVKLVVLKFLV